MAKGNSFAAGEKVRLNIGGPIMVVKHQYTFNNETVTCQWFVGKKLEEGSFAPESLVRVTDDEVEAAQPKKKE